MKKATKISIIIILVLCFCFIGCTGCKKETLHAPEHVEKVIPDTDISLLRNGGSDYTVVIPENPSKIETAAYNVLNEYFYEASGITFPVIGDAEVTFDSQKHYISLGATNVLYDSGTYIDEDLLGMSGFKIIRKGNTVLLTGSFESSARGTLYAVYEFLHHQLGYHYYAENEIALRHNVNYLALKDFDLTEVPDFDQQALGFGRIINNTTYQMRLRTVNFGNEDWIAAGHTNPFNILPAASYYNDHPDWFTSGGMQLCLTNTEMRAEFIKNCKGLIDQNPNGKYFMFGQGDNTNYCTCENCTAALGRCGTQSGIFVSFANYIAGELDAWLSTEYPGREMEYSILAYQYTEAPPVIKNADGSYRAFSGEAIPRHNLAVMWAPIGFDYMYGFDYANNSSYVENLKGWKALTNNIYYYSYSTNYTNYLIPYNNLGSIASIYQELKKYGIKYVYESGPWDTNTATFEELRVYLHSQLMWDCEQDFNALAECFMAAYYKGAAPAMKKYFDAQRNWMNATAKEYNLTGTIYNDWGSDRYWPKGILDNFMICLNEGYAAIEPLKNSDPQMYGALHDRIDKESVSVKYMLLRFYRSYYSANELNKMLDDFENLVMKFGIVAQAELKSIFTVINEWRR